MNKLAIKIFLVSALQCVLVFGHSYASNQPLILKISRDVAHLKDGAIISVNLTNTSAKNVKFGLTIGEVGYSLSPTFRVEVWHRDGSPASMTHLGRIAYGKRGALGVDDSEHYIGASQSVIKLTIRPGETRSFFINVGDFFDLSPSDSYLIRVTRLSDDPEFRLVSNILELIP